MWDSHGLGDGLVNLHLVRGKHFAHWRIFGLYYFPHKNNMNISNMFTWVLSGEIWDACVIFGFLSRSATCAFVSWIAAKIWIVLILIKADLHGVYQCNADVNDKHQTSSCSSVLVLSVQFQVAFVPLFYSDTDNQGNFLFRFHANLRVASDSITCTWHFSCLFYSVQTQEQPR